MTGFFFFIGDWLLKFLRGVGEATVLFAQVLAYLWEVPRSLRNIFKEMLHIGVRAVSIACVMAFFTGMVLALQTGDQLALYGIKNALGGLVGLSMVKELGPVFIALLVAGRAGSAMAAEIATMSVSEEIFALRSMGIDPVRFLVMPKFVASCLMVPILVIFANLFGFLGGALMSNVSVGLDYSTYFDGLFKSISWDEHMGGLVKSLIFGGIISIVSCHQGFKAEGGAEQVGAATTQSVVYSFMAVFVTDYFITKLLKILM